MRKLILLVFILTMVACAREEEPAEPPAVVAEITRENSALSDDDVADYFGEPEYYDDLPTYMDYGPTFTAEPLPDHIIEFITGVTFHENTPFGYDFLAYLSISYVDFSGQSQVGHMIVAAEIADEVLEIFKEIYEARFPIYRMMLIDYFYADDYLSLHANNTSAFNFRYIAGTRTISRHGFGMAIDINPIQNPYIRGTTIKPALGAEYLDRDDVRQGMIVRGDVVYRAFVGRGWTWGGNWTLPRDYHHFERR